MSANRILMLLVFLLSGSCIMSSAQGTLRHHRHPRIRVEAVRNFTDRDKVERVQRPPRMERRQHPPRHWQMRFGRKHRRPCKCLLPDF